MRKPSKTVTLPPGYKFEINPPITTLAEKESLANAIAKISEGVTALQKSGLNTHAIIVLLHDHTKVPRGSINAVLHGLADLKGRYCK